MAKNPMRVVPKRGLVLQFRVSLFGIEPEIWRRIVVPENYSFWELHVAIQDAMGWLDYHLHVFELGGGKNHSARIGIPDPDFGDDISASWEVQTTEYFRRPGDSASYEYDFGDGWRHTVLLEGILLPDSGRYPRCIAGERACPPEDCGGPPGYERLLEILDDPDHAEYKDMNEWLKGHAKNYHPYRSSEFHPQEVHFDDPERRWKKAFSETG